MRSPREREPHQIARLVKHELGLWRHEVQDILKHLENSTSEDVITGLDPWLEFAQYRIRILESLLYEGTTK